MKKNNNYKTVFLGLIILVGLFFLSRTMDNKADLGNASPYALKVLEHEELWIYEVYDGDSLFIRQEYIPAVKGKQGFKTKEEAEKIGNLVLTKLSENKMPIISIRDLNANAIRFSDI